MDNIFLRKPNQSQKQIYDKVLNHIKERNQQLLKQITTIKNNYNNKKQIQWLDIYNRFYLDQITNINQLLKYIQQLQQKIQKMNNVKNVKMKIATKYHPINWIYNIGKFLYNKFNICQNYTNFKIYGVCVPFKIGRPIMLTQDLFNSYQQQIIQIISHELTHSLIHTKDLNAQNYKDAINDAWTYCYLY